MPIAFYMILVCEILLIAFAAFMIFAWLTQTPFYPSSVRMLDELIAHSKVKLPKNGKFIDIGSGDGRFVVWAAARGYDATGIEYNPFLTLWTKFKLFVRGLRKKGRVLNMDFNKHDYKDYDIAYLYIFAEHMDKLKDKLFSEMKPGSVIITNTFKFTELEPDEVIGRYSIYKVN